MKPYSNVPFCLKCGFDEASSTWKGNVQRRAALSKDYDYQPRGYGPTIMTECRDERIERVCKRCGWSWDEAVLTPWTPVEKDR